MRHATIDSLASAAQHLIGPSGVARDTATLTTYGYDAFLEKGQAELVVTPRSVDQLAPLIAAANRFGVPFVARGAGTGYCGGVVPAHGGMVIVLTHLRGTHIDVENGVAVVEPGAVTLEIQQKAREHGWRYVPDPSSYSVCTIGGNIGTNAGGSHCLAHGNTSHYVLALEHVTPTGHVVHLGGPARHSEGLDLRGLVVGAEGTLGLTQRAWLRLVRPPEFVKTVLVNFDETEPAVAMLLQSFREALIPAAMDMNASPLLPDGAGGIKTGGKAILFIDLEGFKEEVLATVDDLTRMVHAHGGRTEVLERNELAARRMRMTIDNWSFMRRTTNTNRYFLFDAGVPRSQLATAMAAMREAAGRHQVPLGNSFHAGDGNIHPAPFFNLGSGAFSQAMILWREILEKVQHLGGTISGEHGVGLEKIEFMPMYYGGGALGVMQTIRRGVDPAQLSNPGKLIPMTPQTLDTEPPRASPFSNTLEVDELDGIVAAPASTSLSSLRAALANTRYELAWVPVGFDEATAIGVVVEAGAVGLRDARTAGRDTLLGGSLRLASGRSLLFGGRISKDVGGYELRKLIFGSQGRLGRLEHVVLKLTPRPTQVAAYQAQFSSVEAAIAFAKRALAEPRPWSIIAVLGTTVALRIDLVRGSIERHRTEIEAFAHSAGVALTELDPQAAQTAWLAHLPAGASFARRAGAPWSLSEELGAAHRTGRRFVAMALTDAALIEGAEPPFAPMTEFEKAVVDAFRSFGTEARS